MSKPKHTPGTWRASSDGISVYSSGGRLVCHCAPRKVLTQQAGNAELIAEAPHLLEMLDWALDAVLVGINELGINPKNSEAYQEALALVAKCKGEE